MKYTAGSESYPLLLRILGCGAGLLIAALGLSPQWAAGTAQAVAPAGSAPTAAAADAAD